MSNWFFIVNPSAGGGKVASLWPTYLPRLQAAFPQLEWAETTRSGEAGNIAIQAIARGIRKIVAVGGDGTHHEVVNGLVDSGQITEVTYALLPVGSGNDWVRTQGIPRNLDRWIEMLRAGNTTQQFLGRVYYKLAGEARSRIFANVAGLAYDAYVVRRSNQLRLKNRFLYPLMTLYYLKDFSPARLRLSYGKEQIIDNPFYTINVGICKYSGGGMRLVPQAEPTGNRFALTYAKQLSVFKILLHGWRFYTGGIGRVKEVTTTFAEEISVESLDGQPVEVEADGEWLGNGPVRFEVVEELLRFVI